MGKSNEPHVCGAKTRSGKPCQNNPMPNGRCRFHGGKSTGPDPEKLKGNKNAVGHGAPSGNQNSRKHGLFSGSLGDYGLEVYQKAKDLSNEEIAKDTAEFLIAKVAEAYHIDAELSETRGAIGKWLQEQVAEGAMSPKVMCRILDRLHTPDIATLGKALGPLKGLLERKRGVEDEIVDDPLDALTEALEASRRQAEED